MSMQVEWHGTQQESFDLVEALNHNCGCEFGLMNARTKTCAAHDMLVRDQRALDGLLFMRRQRERLIAQEQAASDRVVRTDDLPARPVPVKLDCGHYMVDGCLECVFCHRIELPNPLV